MASFMEKLASEIQEYEEVIRDSRQEIQRHSKVCKDAQREINELRYSVGRSNDIEQYEQIIEGSDKAITQLKQKIRFLTLKVDSLYEAIHDEREREIEEFQEFQYRVDILKEKEEICHEKEKI